MPKEAYGIICAYHPAAAGSNPKHTIYAFSICTIEIVMRKGRKWTKRGRVRSIFKKLLNKTIKNGEIG